MADAHLFSDLITIVIAAFAGALMARLLRLPTILGYLGVGFLVGPHALGLVGDAASVKTFAEFGVILLLFTVGVQVSLSDLRRVGRGTALAGVAQVGAMIAVGYAIGRGLGWSDAQAVTLGFALSLSSTMVVLKTLSDRAELGSVHGRVLTGMMVLQDLMFVPMVAVLPALGGNEGFDAGELGFGFLKAGVVLGLIVVLGGRAIPWVLARMAGLGSTEAFSITVVAIAFAAGAATNAVGLSVAVGAFAAGLVISEREWTGHLALRQIMPLRDLFAAFFFASLGMLTDPTFLWDNAALVTALVVVTLGFKLVVTVVAVRLAGYLPHTGILVGAGSTQVGEFGFILAATATTAGVVGTDFLPLIVAVAVITMAVSPGLYGGAALALDKLAPRIRRLRPYLAGASHAERAEERVPRLREHVILAGMGRVGTLIAQALAGRGIPFIVIDEDPAAVRRATNSGYTALLGDSGSDSVLETAGIRRAKLLILAIVDPIAAVVTTQHAERLHPELRVIARVAWREEADELKAAGVAHVVWPELEAGLEMMSLALQEFGVPLDESERQVRVTRHAVAEVLPEMGVGLDPLSESAAPPEDQPGGGAARPRPS